MGRKLLFGILLIFSSVTQAKNLDGRTGFGLTHLALRDTASYSSLYRAFFPDKVFERNGWHLYAH